MKSQLGSSPFSTSALRFIPLLILHLSRETNFETVEVILFNSFRSVSFFLLSFLSSSFFCLHSFVRFFAFFVSLVAKKPKIYTKLEVSFLWSRTEHHFRHTPLKSQVTKAFFYDQLPKRNGFHFRGFGRFPHFRSS